MLVSDRKCSYQNENTRIRNAIFFLEMRAHFTCSHRNIYSNLNEKSNESKQKYSHLTENVRISIKKAKSKQQRSHSNIYGRISTNTENSSANFSTITNCDEKINMSTNTLTSELK